MTVLDLTAMFVLGLLAGFARRKDDPFWKMALRVSIASAFGALVLLNARMEGWL
jgi:hypothetical protein